MFSDVCCNCRGHVVAHMGNQTKQHWGRGSRGFLNSGQRILRMSSAVDVIFVSITSYSFTSSLRKSSSNRNLGSPAR